MWTGSATGEVHASTFRLHRKQQIDGRQSTCCPDCHGSKVDRRQQRPMPFQNDLPQFDALPHWRWFSAMLWDGGNGRIIDRVANLSELTLNAIECAINDPYELIVLVPCTFSIATEKGAFGIM